jgi:hypothetical protein
VYEGTCEVTQNAVEVFFSFMDIEREEYEIYLATKDAKEA